ncbi:hypothetical protein CDD82_1456 [Ophiocordyceps australis]|uniref:Bax Inhibitor family protein n=1 Tax=Ophiocordyceps australis TaxID=1399860 RepID=A0A2C5ZLI2_9HYPO|nr:hypothetical protein CDD82_1456 [Ophiocordyceps australis]
MSFTMAIRQSPARLVQRLPSLSQAAIRPALKRSMHQAAPMRSLVSRLANTRSAFGRSGRRMYHQNTTPSPETADSSALSRKLLLGGAIFGGSLFMINLVLNNERRDAMPYYEREYLNSTFLHTGLGIGIIGLTARQMVQSGFVYRIMVTNPLVVAVGGLALSFATMIATRSISPDNYVAKYACWTAFNATQAALVAPLLAFVPMPLLARAGLYTVGMMGALSLVGATAKQEKYLYIGGPLMAGAAIVALSGLAPLVLPATAMRTLAITDSIWLWGGLVVFGGFTLYDVQKVLKRARMAQAGMIRRDPVNESISLELDFINIFVRLVQIMMMSNSSRR